MKLAAGFGLGGKKDFRASVDKIVDMEKAGLDIVMAGEAWSFDAFTKLAYVAAKTDRVQLATSIVNVYSRSATTIAVTAASVDEMSGGRFILGLGSSGAQVIEGDTAEFVHRKHGHVPSCFTQMQGRLHHGRMLDGAYDQMALVRRHRSRDAE